MKILLRKFLRGYLVIKMNIELIMENLEKNNFKPFFVEKKSDVIPLLKTLINEGETISVGGSVTLNETGVIDFLRNENYSFLDRYEEGLTKDEINDIFRKTFFADTYISSTNAVLESGALYNVDGNSNRVAAIMYGPKSVIIIAGKNKIVKDFNEAVERVKLTAAPLNAARLNRNTYCNAKGVCKAQNAKNPCDGCMSDERICSNFALCGKQIIKDRIKVIIVNENLGY